VVPQPAAPVDDIRVRRFPGSNGLHSRPPFRDCASRCVGQSPASTTRTAGKPEKSFFRLVMSRVKSTVIVQQLRREGRLCSLQQCIKLLPAKPLS
jgi:hypothetical protein